jgi:anti-sigma factor RsiW
MISHLSKTTLQSLADGELQGKQARLAREHLAACGACRSYAEDLRQVGLLVSRISRRTPPGDFVTRVMSRVRLHEALSHPRKWIRWWHVLIPVMSGLAILALTLGELFENGLSAQDWNSAAAGLSSLWGELLSTPASGVSSLGTSAGAWWQGWVSIGTTALPLALALIALGGSVQILRWLGPIEGLRNVEPVSRVRPSVG